MSGKWYDGINSYITRSLDSIKRNPKQYVGNEFWNMFKVVKFVSPICPEGHKLLSAQHELEKHATDQAHPAQIAFVARLNLFGYLRM